MLIPILTDVNGEDHPETVKAKLNQVNILCGVSRYQEAKKLLDKTMQQIEGKLDESHEQ